MANIKISSTPTLPVDEVRLKGALDTLKRYQGAKSGLVKRIRENEAFWRLRGTSGTAPSVSADTSASLANSAWLWSCIVSKHADLMDGYPESCILPRMKDDEQEARRLSKVIPMLLEKMNFEQTYSDVSWYKLKQGTGVYGVFWDGESENGAGDICIRKCDLANLYWEPGITDIQASANVFHVILCDKDTLCRRYPQLLEGNALKGIDRAKYFYDGDTDTENAVPVIDWYYHTEENGRKVLQYCKFTGTTLLYATENDDDMKRSGWYAHGLYPFVFDSLFDIEGSLCGYGYTDIGKYTQRQIDLLGDAIVKNATAAAKPRYFIREGGAVSEKEFADWTKDFVHVDGALGQDAIRPVETYPMDRVYIDVLSSKINELKEITGTRDVTTGGTISGVTAASAIAAIQEAGSKQSRDCIRATYASFRKIVSMCIELIREFYSTPRWIRIGGDEFALYSNAELKCLRKPEFDIRISSQKADPYERMERNELALQLYELGAFDAENAEAALMMLNAMDFYDKDRIADMIRESRMSSLERDMTDTEPKKDRDKRKRRKPLAHSSSSRASSEPSWLTKERQAARNSIMPK